MKTIPYSRQYISNSDIKNVSRALKEDLITTGKSITNFEKKISSYCNSKYSTLVSSATAGLHLACLALGVKKKDIVWCSANSFVASSNAALYCGAKVDFVDINLDDYNLSINNLKYKLNNTPKKKLPKVLIVTHLGGVSANLKEINSLSKKYNFKIIEDASHAFGSTYRGYKIGSCRYSSICVFSFHPIKTITTGEGGACLTNDFKLFKKISSLRSHGIVRNINKKKYNNFYYEQQDLGYNYRLSDINAALGLSQLKRINFVLKYRNQIAKNYRKKLKSKYLKFTRLYTDRKSSNHLFIIRLINEKLIKNHKNIIDYLLSKNISVNIHYYPIYLHPYYKEKGFKKNYCPNAETYYSSSFSIPVFEKMKKKEFEFVCLEIKKIVSKYLVN